MTTNLILGVAGHIDHGKTALVRALTGVNTDRLPEEKKRGITIDLGFAELMVGDFRLGVVDAPGHERFVRNMLAGAASVDIALLVIAADDSVNRQTREHFEILRLLGVSHGIIALTKIDLMEAEWVSAVEAEIREFAADSFLADAPIIRTSVVTGEGIEELKSALESTAKVATTTSSASDHAKPFRMAVDRSFSIAGHGAVVTGSVTSGSCGVGDSLTLLPDEVEVRIRGLQQHDRSAETVQRGQRAAINLAGVHHSQLHRGQELAATGYLKASRRMFVSLQLLLDAQHPLRDRQRVRLHLGSAEVIAAVRFWDRAELAPGETAHAMLALREPASASWGQSFILRRLSPVDTIGGGKVLVPAATNSRRPNERERELLQQLQSTAAEVRGPASLYFEPGAANPPIRLQGVAGVQLTAKLRDQWLAAEELIEVTVSTSRKELVHPLTLDHWGERVAKMLDKLHEKSPLVDAFPTKQVIQRIADPEDHPLVKAAIARLQSTKAIRQHAGRISLKGRGPQLSKGQNMLLEKMVDEIKGAGLAAPMVGDLIKNADHHKDAVPKLIELAAARGELVQISSDYYLHADIEAHMRSRLSAGFDEKHELTVSEIRVLLESTRKYVMPIVAYLDSIGFTKREGDVRKKL